MNANKAPAGPHVVSLLAVILLAGGVDAVQPPDVGRLDLARLGVARLRLVAMQLQVCGFANRRLRGPPDVL
ncbi:MAG: hypothetical protein OXG04_10810 [Acidobacteria bacterium]|nr:hypothetical protein [Acidobacteriota bacterium]